VLGCTGNLAIHTVKVAIALGPTLPPAQFDRLAGAAALGLGAGARALASFAGAVQRGAPPPQKIKVRDCTRLCLIPVWDLLKFQLQSEGSPLEGRLRALLPGAAVAACLKACAAALPPPEEITRENRCLTALWLSRHGSQLTRSPCCAGAAQTPSWRRPAAACLSSWEHRQRVHRPRRAHSLAAGR
jgi:hypothetical protein